MNTSSLVTYHDLINAADDLDRDLATLQVLGYPVLRNRGLPQLLRLAAQELALLKFECWKMSQGETRS